MSTDRRKQSEGGVAVEEREEPKKPRMFRIVMHNDDFTPMEFVVHVLEDIFGIDSERARFLMLTIHNLGLAVVGVFTREIAEAKVEQVTRLAREHGHPLLTTMEPD
jgi:ATP-dependent Clp protease adaptor protein ClpS